MRKENNTFTELMFDAIKQLSSISQFFQVRFNFLKLALFPEI